MYRRFFLQLIALWLFIVLCIFWLDRPIATFVSQYLAFLSPIAGSFTALCDSIFALKWGMYGLLALVGLFCLWKFKEKLYGFMWLAVIVVHFLASNLTSNLKLSAQRARPSYYLAHTKTPDFFNTSIRKDYSFPSGHASYYWGLFLPLALLYRRQAFFLAIIPLLISLSRVLQSFHYVSDVCTSFCIVWILSTLFWWAGKFFLPTNIKTAHQERFLGKL